jgi:hypothetical protein
MMSGAQMQNALPHMKDSAAVPPATLQLLCGSFGQHLLSPTQVLNALSHMNDNAAAVPGRELAKQIYGRDSVFARNPTPAQVGSASQTLRRTPINRV